MKWLTLTEINDCNTAKKACACSQKHWEHIRDAGRKRFIAAENNNNVNLGSRYCALCQLFLYTVGCSKCPIRDANCGECCLEYQDAKKAIAYDTGDDWSPCTIAAINALIERIKDASINEKD